MTSEDVTKGENRDSFKEIYLLNVSGMIEKNKVEI